MPKVKQAASPAPTPRPSPSDKSDTMGGSSEIRGRGMFKSRDNTSIYYEIRGEGPPLLLCYGLTCRREHWRFQIDYFSRFFQVITFDYRGHHASGLPSNDRHLTLEWCARDVSDLLDHLDLKEVILFGHSMGVAVSLLAALQDKKRVKGQVFICGSVHDPFRHMFHTNYLSHFFRAYAVACDWAPATMGMFWKLFTDYNPLSFFITSRFGFNPSTAEERDILMYMEGVHRTPLLIFQSLLSDYSRFDGRELLRKLTTPTLVVAGVEDWITPVYVQEEMAELLPSGELERVPYGSHNAHMDFPERVNRRIHNFLDRTLKK